VNGFDRLNRTMVLHENDPVEGWNARMLVDRMNNYDYVIQHGEAIADLPFDSASNEAVEDGLVDLDSYAIVDWILGEESYHEESLSSGEQALLRRYLENGGALFISGSEIGWDLDNLGSAADRQFYEEQLRANYVGDDAGTYEVTAVPGSVFDGLSGFRFDAAGMYDPDYPDRLSPANGSSEALRYAGGQGGAAVQYADGCERVITFGFPFETIERHARPAVMARVIDFLDECLETPEPPPLRTWLPLILRDTRPADGQCRDVIANGGFELDQGWELNKAAYSSARARHGARSARIGVLPGGSGSGYSSVRQEVALGPGASAVLRLWTYPTGDVDGVDYHYVVVYDASMDDVTTVIRDIWRSDDERWTEKAYDLSSYVGRALRVYIGTYNDGADGSAALYVDDVELTVCP